jgi:thiol:disulfide interchange protein DsbA
MYPWFIRLFTMLALIMTTPLTFGQPSQQAPLYKVLETPLPSDTVGKIEVLEFFSYSCSHCATMVPLVTRWKTTVPANVVFKPVPVAFDASMVPLQRLFFTVEVLGRPELHEKIFDAVLNGKIIPDKSSMRQWLAGQGIDPVKVKFDEIYDSFAVNVEVARATQLFTAYKIEGTPSYAVGGRYITSPSMAGNSYQGALDEVDKLIQMSSSTPSKG